MRRLSLWLFSLVSLFLAAFTGVGVSKSLPAAPSVRRAVNRVSIEIFSTSVPRYKSPSENTPDVQDHGLIEILTPTRTSLPPHPQLHPQTLSTPSATLYEDVPTLEIFRLSVRNGEADQITGIWVDGLMAFEVVPGSGNYVPAEPGTASTYAWATEHGVTALLIHNHLGGTRIYDLETGAMIAVISGDGNITWYIAAGGAWYEAKNYSSEGFAGPFRPWTCTDCEFDLSVSDLRQRHYTWPHHLAIQTCIQTDGRVGLVIFEAQPVGWEGFD